MTRASIYDRPLSLPRSLRPDARLRDRMRRSRRTAHLGSSPGRLDLHIARLARAYRATPERDRTRLLEAAKDALELEVQQLEAKAAAQPRSSRRSPATMNATVELLRRFNRRLTRDSSWADPTDRPLLIALLGLEHRLCYALAGTTRKDFEAVSGRTGLR